MVHSTVFWSVISLFGIWLGLGIWQTLFDKLHWHFATPLNVLRTIYAYTVLIWKCAGQLWAYLGSFYNLIPFEELFNNMFQILLVIWKILCSFTYFSIGYRKCVELMNWSYSKTWLGSATWIILLLVLSFFMYPSILSSLLSLGPKWLVSTLGSCAMIFMLYRFLHHHL